MIAKWEPQPRASALRSKWRDDRRVVPSLRCAAPFPRSGRIPDEGGSSLCAARLRLGKPPQKWDDTAVIPPGLDRHCRAAPSLIMAASPQMWALTTETPGGVEEAHRRWPEGRSERGLSKAKHGPPDVFRGVLPRRPWSKNGSVEDAEPPSRRRTEFYGRAVP